MSNQPTPFEVYEPGVLLHGTKADLTPGDLLVPGRESNFEPGRVMDHVYVTETLDAATWGAELAVGDGPGRIVGELTDWTGHSPETIQAMNDRLVELREQGVAVIYD